MHDHRSGNIPVENTAAVAAVYPVGQLLPRDDPALGARLGSSARIDIDEFAAGAFSLVAKHRDELSPRGIVDMLGQHPCGQALNVEIFDRDTAEGVDNFTALLVQKIAPAISDARLHPGDRSLALAPHPRATLAAGERPLQYPQLAGVTLGDVGASDRRAVAERNEAREPNVEPDAIGTGALYSGHFDVKNDVPFARVAAEDSGLGFARKRAVPTDLYLARHADEAQFTALADREPIADAEVGGMISIARLEAGKAGLCAAMNTAEECFVGLVEFSQNLLLRSCRPTALVRQARANLRERHNLLVAPDRNATPIGADTVLEGSVIQLTKIAKHIRQRSFLRWVGIEAVFVAKDHSLLALKASDKRTDDIGLCSSGFDRVSRQKILFILSQPDVERSFLHTPNVMHIAVLVNPLDKRKGRACPVR